MKNFLKILSVILIVIAIAGGFLYFFFRLQDLETRVNKNNSTVSDSLAKNDTSISENIPVDTCGEICQKTVNDIVAKAISTISSSTKVTEKQTTTIKVFGTAYIPMGTTYTTTSIDWYTVNDTSVYIDLVNDYGKSATVSWEASLKVAHGNGQAYARLWDDTNKIAVNGSELTTINNSSYTLVSTGNLPFWNGRNLYKLQIKSLNSFEVAITGAKIKVEY